MSATEKFEHYEVLKNPDGSLFELGRGAMGITYKALDTGLECFVALKIINPSTIANKDAEQRFFREARIAAQLRHPNIASVFRLGKTDEGAHYYAMEFCEGQTIQQLVEESGPIECRRALQFTLQVTKALIVAEERHLVHRDLKPSNLIVTQRSDEGEVIKVIDFGLAKTTTSEGTMWSSTGTLGFIGTAHFASPEQIEDKPVDTRSDIYSLGSTLWFMLLGKPPFEGSLARIMSQHLTATPDFSRLHGVPEKVVALIRRMMEKSAEDRPQSALELRREIVDYLGNGCIQTAELRDPPDAPKPAIPLAEPPPLPETIAAAPPASEPPPEEKWSPSLRELLRVRGVLSPVEALCIGEHLAAKLGENSESDEGILRIQDVTIHFHDSPAADQTRVRLHDLVTAWPAFDLATTSDNAFVTMASTDPSLMSTIVPGAVLTGDKVQQLARMIYELLGGVAGPRYVPVARLGEAGNEALQRAIELGLSCYPTPRALVEKLRQATADVPQISAHIHPPPSVSPNATTPPPATSGALPETPTKLPEEQSKPPVEPRGISSSLPPPLPSQPVPTSKKPGRSPLPTALKILAGVVGLIAIFDGVKTIHSGYSRNQSPAQDEIPPSSQTPAPSVTAPSTVVPFRTTPAKPTAEPIQFAIFDDLGVGQVSESVQVFVDDQTEPAASIYLNPAQPHGSAVMILPSPGHHTLIVKTESRVIDLDRGVKKIESTGRWDIDFRGGEKYDLSASPEGNGDSYQLAVKLRN